MVHMKSRLIDIACALVMKRVGHTGGMSHVSQLLILKGKNCVLCKILCAAFILDRSSCVRSNYVILIEMLSSLCLFQDNFGRLLSK